MTSFIFIDYENVEPKNVSRLNGGRHKVKVFASAKQKVPVRMASALQALGPDVEYVEMAGEGRNALDFHIAYYIGRLAAQTPGARFHVISADKGFDPLIKHLAEQNSSCQRWKSIAEIPPDGGPETDSIGKRLQLVTADLVRRKNAKPRTVKTLRSTINALFQKQLAEADLDALVAGLTQSGVIKIADGKVQYALPA
jgi:hypothetical protein